MPYRFLHVKTVNIMVLAALSIAMYVYRHHYLPYATPMMYVRTHAYYYCYYYYCYYYYHYYYCCCCVAVSLFCVVAEGMNNRFVVPVFASGRRGKKYRESGSFSRKKRRRVP